MVLIGTKQSDVMSKENRVMVVSMIVNITLSILKIISGIVGYSSALIADGIHSLSDLTTDVFAIIGNFLSRKPADDKHPFGHGRLEYITSMGISLIIMFVGFSIIYNSMNRDIIIPSIYVLAVTLFTIIAKYLLAQYVIKKGTKYQNNILISSGKESKADVISSIFVLMSTILMQFSNNISIFRYADIVVAIIVGMLIIRVGFNLLKENVSTTLGEQETDDEIIDAISSVILKEKEVIQIDSINCIKYGSYFRIVSEVSMDGNLTLNDSHAVVEKIEKRLMKQDKRNKYITIHVNPYLEKGK